MPVLIRSYSNKKLVYYQVPKNGSTTIANMFNQADGLTVPQEELSITGRDNGYSYKITHVQTNAQGPLHYEPVDCDISFAVKRDPIERFISNYNNRIIFHNDLGRELPGKPLVTPSVDDFIKNFDSYITQHWIKIHFLPQHYYGGDTKDLTKIFTLQQMSEVAAMIAPLSGKDIKVYHLQQGGNINKLHLSADNIAWIKKYYEVDYDTGWC